MQSKNRRGNDGVQHFHTFYRENETGSDAEAKKETKAKTNSQEQIRAFTEVK